MKRLLRTTIVMSLLTCFRDVAPAQMHTSPTQTTIAGISLCETTVEDLKRICSDLQEVQVDEQDALGDSRYINGKGFTSQKFHGLIFQSDENAYISKVRLTKDFDGNLPDGKRIKMKDLLVKDVMKIYPQLADKWTTTEVSKYWRISNDTITYYVKIDTARPRFPLDEAFYLERPVEGIDVVLSCYSVHQQPDAPVKLNVDPIFFLDSVNVTRYELEDVNPNDIANVTVYKDSNAIRLVGPDGKYGVIYIHTKRFFREKYWKYLSSKSKEYREAIPTPESDNSVAYIVNAKVLKDVENSLASINDNNFISLKVIRDKKTMNRLGIKNKTAAIVVDTKPDVH